MAEQQAAMPKAIEDCTALLAWIIPKLDGFPRNRRFTLGERIEAGLLSELEMLIEAAYQKQRAEALYTANRKLDVVRHLWRLSHTLKLVSHACYGQGAERFTDLGKQIGGWKRYAAGSPDR